VLPLQPHRQPGRRPLRLAEQPRRAGPPRRESAAAALTLQLAGSPGPCSRAGFWATVNVDAGRS
jgi:hypothetical protein